MIPPLDKKLASFQEEQQLEQLINEEIEHLKGDNQHHQSSTEEDEEEYRMPQNAYFDKQLTHLVLSQEFDFKQISKILSSVFRHEHLDTSENACRLRWAQLHKNRHSTDLIKEIIKQEKRSRSVAAFANPYSLYSVDELIQNLQANEKKEKETSQSNKAVFEPIYEGYNIFKDNFRKIKDFEEYNSKQKQMKEALAKAQLDVYEQKPLFFSPEYECSGDFKVKEEEMTAEKVRKLMAFQIQMEKVSRELNRQDLGEPEQYRSIIKRKIENQSRRQENDGADFDDDWDGYESD